MIKRIQNASLQTKIMMLLILMSTFLSFTLGAVFYQNTAENALKNKEKEMLTLASLTSNKVERFLFERSADIKVLSESKIFTMPEVSNQTRLNYLKNVIQAYQAYDAVFTLDNKGHIDIQSGTIPSEPEIESYMDSFLSGESFMSDIVLTDHSRYLYFSEPLRDDQSQIVGAIVEVMNFDSIQTIIDSIKFGNTGYVYLEKQESGILNETSSDIQQITMNHTYYMTATYPLIQYPTQHDHWNVVVAQEKNEALIVKSDIEKYFLYVVVGFLLFFYVLSVIISRHITRPIRLLMAKANTLMVSNQKFASDIVVSDEVKNLTKSFDLLLEELQFMMQQVLEKSGEAAHIDLIRSSIDELIEGMPNGILTVDQNGQITSVNDYAVETLYMNSFDLVGKTLETHGISHLSPLFESLNQTFVSHQKKRDEVCQLTGPKGEDIKIVFSTLMQYDRHDHFIGMTIIVNHMDAKRNFEESILRAKKLSELGELSAGVAHEIRNPLASIRGYAQIALREMNPDDQIASDIAVILLEVDRLDKIIERFMSFASPNNPKLELYHINDIIRDTIRLIGKDTTTKGINLRHRYTKKDLVRVDYEQIKQVLINLILNAVQAMPKGGMIEIVTLYSEINGTMEIYIVDEGEGIPPDIREQIFKPFFTTREKGSGLGLSICSRIIENHNGIMDISSNENGTQVIIKLPVKGIKQN